MWILSLFVGCAALQGVGESGRGTLFGSLQPHPRAVPIAPPVELDRLPLQGPSNRAQNTAQSPFQIPPGFQQSSQMPAIAAGPLTKVDANVWRSGLDAQLVFGMLNRIIAQDYVITQMDKRIMNISTDWDKFFIEGRLFRNRLNISVFALGNKQTEVVIKNIVEYYAEDLSKNEQIRWLPCSDITNEVDRLLENVGKQAAMLANTRRAPR